MSRIREILLTQYIGAITIALVAAQGLTAIVNLATIPLRWYLEFHNPGSQSVLFNATPRQIPFPWQGALMGATGVVLYLGVAYGLLRWLYPTASKDVHPPSEDDSPSESETRA